MHLYFGVIYVRPLERTTSQYLSLPWRYGRLSLIGGPPSSSGHGSANRIKAAKPNKKALERDRSFSDPSWIVGCTLPLKVRNVVAVTPVWRQAFSGEIRTAYNAIDERGVIGLVQTFV